MDRFSQLSQLLAAIPHIDDLCAARDAENVSAWIVGGVVRDILLGREPVDVDVATQQPQQLARRFAGLINGRVVPMDPERGIWRVAISAGKYFDFCEFRDTDITGDLLGRDFTINAIAVRLPEGDDPGGLYDPLHGLDALNAGQLRQVYPQVFVDYPLRVLRAFRFQSELNYDIENTTWGALHDAVDRLPLVAPERILAEWWKICGGPYAAKCIARMDEANVLDTILPEISDAKGVTQNAYHHLDVWQHTLLTVTNTVRFLAHPEEVFLQLTHEFAQIFTDAHRRARLVFLALIHDMGKPASRTQADDTVHFYGHDIVGAEIAEKICTRLRVSREDTRIITTVVRHHLRPLHLMNARKRGELSEKAMIKFFDDLGDCTLDVMALAMADKAAGQGPAAATDVLEQLRALYTRLFAFYHEHYLPAINTPFLTGSDLTQQLQLTPGPQIGHLLRRARDLQMRGQFTGHDDALNWAMRHRHEP